jgi:hypothetical protein
MMGAIVAVTSAETLFLSSASTRELSVAAAARRDLGFWGSMGIFKKDWTGVPTLTSLTVEMLIKVEILTRFSN